VHRPDVLILDEPTNAMDPAGVVEVRDLLRQAADSGTAVFMSTHIVTEVATSADYVGIIHQGRLIQQLDRADLQSLGRRRLRVRLTSPDGARRAAGVLRAAGHEATATEATVLCTDERSLTNPEQVAVCLVQHGTPPMELVIDSDSLEAHFLHVTGGHR
jgi:ABC-2 type transport system ATP-binding protein